MTFFFFNYRFPPQSPLLVSDNGEMEISVEEMETSVEEMETSVEQLNPDSQEDISLGLYKTPQRIKPSSVLPSGDLSPLNYETESITVPKEPSSKRVLCDLLHLIEQA